MLWMLWLLLPVAAASGWYLARRSLQPRLERGSAVPNAEYFKGLNFLLNEQPDKAIEVFIRLLDVDSDTVETHLALGNLFRRRGETDRAIRIHQNLIARPTLDSAQRDEALQELGQDYMRAGLLDRAEGLFRDLASRDRHQSTSLAQLLEIYQQERDWEQAIDIARRLDQVGDRDLKPLIAHLYCEQAEVAAVAHDYARASESLKQALSFDRGCARASILRGDLALQANKLDAAIKAYRQVEQQDPEFLPEVLPKLESCYQAQGVPDGMISYLSSLSNRNHDGAVVSCMARQLLQQQGGAAARIFLTEQLRQWPSQAALTEYVGLCVDEDKGPEADELEALKGALAILENNQPGYVCQSCGFSGKTMHWQCPGCKRWGTVKPVRECIHE